MDQTSDEDLMLRIQTGESHLLAALFERHHRRIYNYMLRMTNNRCSAEDLASEVFIRLLKYSGSYQRQARFSTWLYQIARNLFLDHVEKQRPQDSLDDLPVPLQSEQGQPDQELQREQESQLMRKALSQLADRKREVLILSRYQDMRYDDIAVVMGCTTAAVKILVHRSLKELREIYQQISAGGQA